MKKIAFLFIGVMIMSSCSVSSKHFDDSTKQYNNANCVVTKEAVNKKKMLEAGIRGQVKFVDEVEQLYSLTTQMEKYKIPALSLAVINEGEIEWADIYHNEHFSSIKKLNCTSIFQAASLSKPVTFLAAIRMHAAGGIDLDKDIQHYLKHFELPAGKQTKDNPITFRNIFSHTSGIARGGYQGYARNVDLPTDINILKGSKGANSPAIEVVTTPNEVLAYSGGAYTLAEVALQDIYNDEFSNIMQEWILDPLGMKHSTFAQPLVGSKTKKVAQGHTATGSVVKGGWHNYPEQAAAGLWSNASDMAKILIEIYKAYQGEKSIFRTTDIRSIIQDEREGHVYGFMLHRTDDDIAMTHYGGNEGYRTGMTISLTSGKGLVYLINSDNGIPLANELLLSASEVYGWEHFKQTNVKRRVVDIDLLKKLPGTYKWNNQIDLSVTFDDTDNLIVLHFPNGDQYKLTSIVGEELDFIHSGTGIKVSFVIKDNYQSFVLYGQLAKKITEGE